MIALDTNVLVRFIVQDDPLQFMRSKRLIGEVVRKNSACFISDVVFCELFWVLRGVYRFRREQILSALDELVTAGYTAFSSRQRLQDALDAYRRGTGDFSDYLIREHAREVGCTDVKTFDRSLLKEPGFSLP